MVRRKLPQLPTMLQPARHTPLGFPEIQPVVAYESRRPIPNRWCSVSGRSYHFHQARRHEDVKRSQARGHVLTQAQMHIYTKYVIIFLGIVILVSRQGWDRGDPEPNYYLYIPVCTLYWRRPSSIVHTPVPRLSTLVTGSPGSGHLVGYSITTLQTPVYYIAANDREVKCTYILRCLILTSLPRLPVRLALCHRARNKYDSWDQGDADTR